MQQNKELIKAQMGDTSIPIQQRSKQENKKVHMKYTFQPMVGGIRKTVYKFGMAGMEEIMQKLCNVIPEGYGIRVDIKIFPLEQDSHIKAMLGKNVPKVEDTKFNANQKVGSEGFQGYCTGRIVLYA